jgi:peptidoglycan/xylan/chitin deacetylase (PgdA/CDA1 family)
LKHRLKLFLREAYARLLFHTGLHALVDRVMPRRWTVLAGHCVADPGPDGPLPRDMKISRAKLERLLRWLARRYELLPVAAAARRVAEPGRRSLVSLSMDDGYRDNVTALLPLCRALGVAGTIYVESRPLDERRVNWTHKLFWILARRSPAELVHRFTEVSTDARTNVELNRLVAHGEATVYRVKRVLKYDVPPAERDRAVDVVFLELGGDERALCDDLYMTWDGARALRDAGFEIGGHTVGHAILSQLGDEELRGEVEGVERALEREIGPAAVTFAYPFGRRWDYDERAQAAVRASGFTHALTTHAGTNDARTDPMQLRRLMIDEDARLHLLAAEACGGFDLLRRFGLDWSE